MGEGNSMTQPSLKGLRSVPKVQTNCPINDSLISFVLPMIIFELCPIVLSDHSIRRLRSPLFLSCPTRVSIDSK